MNQDAELLEQYAAQRSEAAFAELTRRHLDLVYSAALRMLNGNVHSAQDVTQQVFTEVASQARRLAQHPTLVGWLYTTTRRMALRVIRADQRRQAREQEAETMTELLHDDTPPCDWAQLAPVIEDALHELGDTDRAAILLRFFQNKPLHEVGAGLNLSENAARMRVERALEKLRGKLAQRGITTTATALGAMVCANAVQAAPAGLATTISTAAMAGSTLQAWSLTAAIKTIVMTTTQKTIVAASLVLAAGTGIYAVHQSSQLQSQLQRLERERATLTGQVRQLEQQGQQASNELTALAQENTRLKSGQDAREVLKLRGQVGALRQAAGANQATSQPQTTGLAKLMSDPAMREYIRQAQIDKFRSWYADLFKELKLTPEQSDRFLQVFADMASSGMAKYTASPGQAATSSPEELSSQLHDLLGDTGYARFKEFTAQIPARVTVSLLDNQLGNNALSSEQSARLLEVVNAEPRELTLGITGAPDKALAGSQADADAFLGQVTQSNQRIVQQAASFLSADQVATLENLLANALTTRKSQAAALLQKH